MAALSLGGCHTYSYTRGWIELQSRDLRIRTNLPQIYAEPFVERYQRARDVIAETEFRCAFDRISAPIDVILIGGVYGDVLIGSHASGFYVRPQEPLVDLGPSIVINPGDEDRHSYVFLHELTHRLIDECVPSAPTWLHEGLATFYETAIIEGEELRVGYPSAVFSDREGDLTKLSSGQTVGSIPLDAAPTFPELRGQDESEFYEDGANYQAAWVAVHLIKLDPGFERRFDRYLTALSRGEDEHVAWGRCFGDTDIDERYRKHLTADHDFLFRPATVIDSRAHEIEPLPSADVALLLSTFYEWTARRGAKVARGYMKYAHSARPGSAEPLLYLASLHASRGQWRRAKRALEKALSLERSNPDVLSAALQFFALRGADDGLSGDERQRIDTLASDLIGDADRSYHYVALSNWLLFSDEAEAAMVSADRAIELDPRSPLAQVAAGEAALALGEIQQGREHLRTALGLTDHAEREKRQDLQRRLEALGPVPGPDSP